MTLHNDEIETVCECQMGQSTDSLKIHIHEHIGPLRERVGRIEGAMQVHDRELSLLRSGLEGLRDRVDDVRTSLLAALSEHTTDEIDRYNLIRAGTEEVRSQVVALKNWVLAIGLGAGAIFAVMEFLVRSGLLTHG